MAMPGVAVPLSLTNEASPIINKALETGARGRTVEVTDYSKISDAFFKKAALDMNMANLQADLGVKQAQIMSNLEMGKAELDQNMIGQRLDYDMKLRDIQKQIEDNQVGFFEGLLNVASGVAGGVAIAATAGAATPVVIGAGAAGGLLTAGAQAQGGRRGAQGAREALGTMAGAASLFRQSNEANQAKDRFGQILDTANNLMGMFNSGNSGQRQQALAGIDSMVGSIRQYGASVGMNPQQIDDMTDRTVRGITGGAGLTEVPMLKRLADFASDPNQNTPAGRNQLKNDMASLYGQRKAGGGKDIKGVGQWWDAELKSMNPDLPSMFAMPGGSQPAQSGGTQPPTMRPPQQRQQAGVAGVGGGSVTPAQPQKGNAVQQQAQQQQPLIAEPIDQFGRATGAPIALRGAEMDHQPATTSPEAVQPLTEIGAKSAEVLQKEKERSLGDKILHGGEVAFGLGVPGLLDQKGIKEDQQNRVIHNQNLVAQEAAKKGIEGKVPDVIESKRQEMEQVTPRTEEGRVKKQAGLDALYDLNRIHEALPQLPEDLTGQLLTRWHTEGITVTDVAAMAGVAGAMKAGIQVGTKQFAAKAMELAKEYGAKVGGAKGAGAIGIGVGVGSAMGHATDLLDKINNTTNFLTKGKGVGLTSEQVGAITEFMDATRGYAEERIQSNSGKQVVEESKLQAEIKNMVSLKDKPEIRAQKFASMLSGQLDSADSFIKTYKHDVPMGAKGGSGGSKAKGFNPQEFAAKARLQHDLQRQFKEEDEQRKQNDLGVSYILEVQ